MVGGFAKLFEEKKKRKFSPMEQSKSNSNISMDPFVSKNKKQKHHNGPKKKGENSKNDSGHNSSKRQEKRHEWVPPSAEALKLSAKLKELSSKKRLRDALSLYWDKSNDSIRDHHHGGIIIDCCSRCGAVEEGEKVIEAMEKAGETISVQAYTSLMKGYAHASNKMDKAFDLFKKMFASNNKRDHPNVRTLNTFLRGCLWSASLIVCNEDDDRNNSSSSGTFYGGVLASEAAWSLCKAKNENKKDNNKLQFDVSSYEYSIALLCNALLVKEASEKIRDMKEDTNIQTDLVSFHEGLTNVHVALARAYALLGLPVDCKAAANEAMKSINIVTKNSNNMVTGSTHGVSKTQTKGGKRAWSKIESEQRAESNTLFRGHKMKELRDEANILMKYADNFRFSTDQHKMLLSRLIETRIICLGGGGTTELDARKASTSKDNQVKHSSQIEHDILRTLWFSFGLAASKNKAITLTSVKQATGGNVRSVSWGSDLRKLCKRRKVFGNDGLIDFTHVFTLLRMPCIDRNKQNENSRPIFIELGSGSGDWITLQANENPTVDYVSVELRSDRVSQTFAKAIINSNSDQASSSKSSTALTNLCCVGAECGSFLSRVQKGSVSKIFVNHPEPPIQWDSNVTLNEEEEMGHMLNSETLLIAATSLKRNGNGNFIIVTDNKWYAQLIAKTFLRIMKKNPKLLRCKNVRSKELREFDSFSEGKDQVHILCGQPCKAIGHHRPTHFVGQGTSYFDRLWRTGAGSHSEKLERFIIVMETV